MHHLKKHILFFISKLKDKRCVSVEIYLVILCFRKRIYDFEFW